MRVKDLVSETPVIDFLLALHLLETPWGGNSVRILVFSPDESVPNNLRIDYYSSGYTKDLYSDSEVYRINNDVARELVVHGFVRKVDPDNRDLWTLTASEQHRAYRRIPEERWSSETLAFYTRVFDERENRLKQFFKPGIHSSFSGVLFRRRHNFDAKLGPDGKWKHQLSILYDVPGQEWVRICDDGSVEHGKRS